MIYNFKNDTLFFNRYLVVPNINNVGLKLLYFPTFYLKNYPTLLISRTT